jgi:hypothetical protein
MSTNIDLIILEGLCNLQALEDIYQELLLTSQCVSEAFPIQVMFNLKYYRSLTLRLWILV